jgi:hypothetical protein
MPWFQHNFAYCITLCVYNDPERTILGIRNDPSTGWHLLTLNTAYEVHCPWLFVQPAVLRLIELFWRYPLCHGTPGLKGP